MPAFLELLRKRDLPSYLFGFWLTVLVTFLFTVPIYTDEITYRWFDSRYFQEGWYSLSNFPQCGTSFLVETPWLFRPARLLESVIYGITSSPILIRALGLVATLTFLFVLRAISFSRTSDKLGSTILTFGIMSFGMLPFLWTLNRPESRILLGLAILLLVTLRQNRVAWVAWLLTLPLIFSYHGKVLILTPFLIVIGLSICQKIWAKVSAISWLGFCGVTGFVYWRAKLECTDSKSTDALLKSLAIRPAQVVESPADFVKAIGYNLRNIGTYFSDVKVRGQDFSFWLPNFETGFASLTLNIFLLFSVVTLMAICLYEIAARAFEAPNPNRLNLRLQLSLATSIVGLCLLQTSKAHYDAYFFFGLCSVFVCLTLTKIPKFLSAGLTIASVSSTAVLFYNFAGYVDTWTKQTELSNEVYAFSAFRYEQTRSELLRIAGKCGIAADGTSSHLVLDDPTYLTFANTAQPYNWLFITGTWGRGIPNVWRFLESKNSSGLVIRCSLLPARAMALAESANGFCCLSKQMIGQLSRTTPERINEFN